MEISAKLKLTWWSLAYMTLVLVNIRTCHGTAMEKATGVLWEIKPYYWIDKDTNRSQGIIAESLQMIKDGCFNSNDSKMENLETTVILDNLETFYETFRNFQASPYQSGILENVTHLSARWLPVIQEFGVDHYANRSMTEKTLFTEPKSAVVVHREKISLFYKLKLGIWQTKHILVLSFLSAIIFAILVWFAVSSPPIIFHREKVRYRGGSNSLYFEFLEFLEI